MVEVGKWMKKSAITMLNGKVSAVTREMQCLGVGGWGFFLSETAGSGGGGAGGLTQQFKLDDTRLKS